MNDEILTKKEVAEILKITERMVDKLRKEGLPSFKVGTNVRFEKKEVLEWIKES